VVIVGGTFEVEPHLREQFLAGRLDLMRNSRAERGCLEYIYSADPLNPGRVVLFERWSTKEDLDAHLAASRAAPSSAPATVKPQSGSITVYEVAGERPL
jgi:quinol monooxygenase YgiN